MLFHCDCTKFAITVSALMPNRIVNFDNRLMKKILLLCGLLLCSAFYVVADDTLKQPAAIDAAWFKANYAKAEYMIPMRDGVRLYTAVYTPKNKKPKSSHWPIPAALLTSSHPLSYCTFPFSHTGFPAALETHQGHSCHRAFALSVLLPEMLLVWICTAHSFTSSRLCSNIPLSTTSSPENSHVPHPFLPHPALFLFSLQTCFIICICLSFIVYLSPLECQLCEVRNQFHSLKHAKCPESRRHSRNTC